MRGLIDSKLALVVFAMYRTARVASFAVSTARASAIKAKINWVGASAGLTRVPITTTATNSIRAGSSSTSLSMSEAPDSIHDFYDKPQPISNSMLPSLKDVAVKDVSPADAFAVDADMLVLPVYQPSSDDDDKDKNKEEKDEDEMPVASFVADAVLTGDGSKDALEALASALSVQSLIEDADFKGTPGSSLVVPNAGAGAGAGGESAYKWKRLLLVGIGPRPKDDKKDDKDAPSPSPSPSPSPLVGAFSKVGSTLASLTRTYRTTTKSVAVVLSTSTTTDSSSPTSSSTDEVEGVSGGLWGAGSYSDDRFRTGKNVQKPLALESLTYLVSPGADVAAMKAKHEEVSGVLSGVTLAKDLVNAPPNYLTPGSMAETAKAELEALGMEVEILEEDEIQRRNMGAYWAVAKGSVHPPRFIHATYKGDVDGSIEEGKMKKFAIVGKGLTFDSGGYNLKVGASMIELMKFDMGGAASTLGAAKAIGCLKPKNVEVHFIVAACENMVSDTAMRPGDVVKASNGKTIEVINTDAEGRLTLADALVFAENLGDLDGIIDLATLTGACLVALGADYAAVYGSDEAMLKSLQDSAKRTNEKMWNLPLPAEYKDMIKSKIADIQNVGGRYGGSITAALFLQEFVKSTPWIHVDMAGPVWDQKTGSGATGYGVKMLTEFIVSEAKTAKKEKKEKEG